MNGGSGLSALALGGLQKCLARISRASTGTWRVSSASDFRGTAGDIFRERAGRAAAAVCLGLEDVPLHALLLASPSELSCVSKSFTGHGFPPGPAVSAAERVMLSELGNILLNALINPLLNALNKGLLPTTPGFLDGDAGSLPGKLPTGLDPEAGRRVISAVLDLECEGEAASLELFAFLPEDLALRIENR